MTRTPLRRLGRFVVMGLAIAAIAAVGRALGRARVGGLGAGATSGDTWPPVPVNADRGLNHGAWETATAP